jgi:hypothetical protein
MDQVRSIRGAWRFMVVASVLAQSPVSAQSVLPAPPPPAAPQTGEQARPRRRDAQAVTEEGNFLPGIFAARIGDQRVSALAFGGYDTNGTQGGVFSGVIEGAIINRIAIRVGYDYLQSQTGGNVSAGVRFGVLRQETSGIDLGVFVQYKQKGFSESNGEVEMALAMSRRWGRFGLFGDLVYGQGFERQERDGEVRIAGLYTLRDRYNVGFEARSHFDLGSSSMPPLRGSPPEAAFDLIAGPVASISLGPIALLAEAGVHVLVIDNPTGADGDAQAGLIALAGAGAAF